MIENRQIVFDTSALRGEGTLGEAVENRLGNDLLRWYISRVTDREVVVEATVVEESLAARSPDGSSCPLRAGRSAVVSIVPTGVGCEIGGFAGDAGPATRLLGATADYVVTNPNAVNASNFLLAADNVLYTEGLCIDRFCRGEVELFVPRSNKVGLIVERTTPERLEMVFNVTNAVRAVHGVELAGHVVTEGPIGSRSVLNGSGAYSGTVDHPEEILRATEELIRRGAQAIAITTNVLDLPHDEYVAHFEGRFPNPMGGVEAIISHLVVHRFGLPAAHAPMVNLKDLELEERVVDARAAGEMASQSGLACVLMGLARAPQMSLDRGPRIVDAINVHNLLAVVAPAGCLGGIPMIYADRSGIPIIAVRDNATVLDVTRERLGLRHVLEARNYLEAAGLVLALSRGIDVASVGRPFPTLRPDAPARRPVPERRREAERLAREPVPVPS